MTLSAKGLIILTMPTDYRLVFITAPDMACASSLADGLLKKRLAACVSMSQGIISKYRWKGRIETAKEVLLIIKTGKHLIPGIMRFVKENHPYSVPEVLCTAVTEGGKSYLDWLKSCIISSRGRRGK